MSCEGKCKRYEKSRKYDTENSRYCKICEIFMEYKNNTCPCCNTRLKIKPRNARRKREHEEKYPERAIKRI